jgi:hypothetical protein
VVEEGSFVFETALLEIKLSRHHGGSRENAAALAYLVQKIIHSAPVETN